MLQFDFLDLGVFLIIKARNSVSCYILRPSNLQKEYIPGENYNENLVKKIKQKGKKTFLSSEFKNNKEIKLDLETCFDKWTIPGGELKNFRCRGWFPKNFCKDCGQIILVNGNCSSPQCPDCCTRWRYKRVKKAFQRVYSYKITNKTRVGHLIVSIAPDDYDKITDETIKDVYKFLKIKGVKGGMILYHPFRIKKERRKELFEIFRITKTPGLGEFALWKVLIKVVENWRDYVYYSPHYHIVGCFNWLQNAASADPFVYKRIGDLHQPEDLVKCMMYQLSHVGLRKDANTHSIRWFGELGNSCWSSTKASEKVQYVTKYLTNKILNHFADTEGTTYRNCPVCGGEIISILDVHQYLNDFFSTKQLQLKFAYAWATGSIPPPKDIDKILWLIG